MKRWSKIPIWIGVIGLVIWVSLWLLDSTKKCSYGCTYYGLSYLIYAIPFILLIVIPIIISRKNNKKKISQSLLQKQKKTKIDTIRPISKKLVEITERGSGKSRKIFIYIALGVFILFIVIALIMGILAISTGTVGVHKYYWNANFIFEKGVADAREVKFFGYYRPSSMIFGAMVGEWISLSDKEVVISNDCEVTIRTSYRGAGDYYVMNCILENPIRVRTGGGSFESTYFGESIIFTYEDESGIRSKYLFEEYDYDLPTKDNPVLKIVKRV